MYSLKEPVENKLQKSSSLSWKFVGRAVVLIATIAKSASGYSAQYFVDPVAGNDANAGTAQVSPWKTIPGMRLTNNSDFLRTNWGAITSANRIKAGDFIDIKAGTSMTSTIGGSLLISSTFYDNGTSTLPITIRVSSTWPAANGHFTYNATGMTPTFNGGTIDILFRDYIKIQGANATRNFRLINSTASNALQVIGTSSTPNRGFGLSFSEVAFSPNRGVMLAWANDWIISNVVSHDHGNLGFDIGGSADQVNNNGLISDSEAYAINFTNCASLGGLCHGFGLYGSTNITFKNCKARNNGRDGFDFGSVGNNATSTALVVNSASYDNGEDGFGANGSEEQTSKMNTYYYINSVAFNNGQAGWDIYEAADVYLLHVIAHHNGNQNGFGGNFMIYSNASGPTTWTTKVTIRNSIGYKPKTYANVYSYQANGRPTVIDSDYNIFVPRSSDSETFAETPYATGFTYTSPPSWKGPHDKVGIAHDPGFTAISTASFAGNNYRLLNTTGPAINSGLYWNVAPSAILQDKANINRANPPEIGMYEK